MDTNCKDRVVDHEIGNGVARMQIKILIFRRNGIYSQTNSHSKLATRTSEHAIQASNNKHSISNIRGHTQKSVEEQSRADKTSTGGSRAHQFRPRTSCARYPVAASKAALT